MEPLRVEARRVPERRHMGAEFVRQLGPQYLFTEAGNELDMPATETKRDEYWQRRVEDLRDRLPVTEPSQELGAFFTLAKTSTPIWDQFVVLSPPHDDRHPLGCHRPRILDRVVFDKLIAILVFGCAYARIADATCSATTLRHRRDEWIAAGVMEHLFTLVLAAYDQMIGLNLEHLAIDGCMTMAPCGGEVAERSPVN